MDVMKCQCAPHTITALHYYTFYDINKKRRVAQGKFQKKKNQQVGDTPNKTKKNEYHQIVSLSLSL
jgi:hypothetical protein